MRAECTISRLSNGSETTIVAFGDSLTYGWMVQKGYLDFLNEMLLAKYPDSNFSIVNKGIPGDTAFGGLHRLREDAVDYNPDCVLVQFALNDLSIGIPPNQYKNNVQEIIDQIRAETSAEVVLLTSVSLGNSMANETADRYYSRLDELSEKNEAPIARVHVYWQKKIDEGYNFSSLVQFDMVHPTTEGYRLMAEAVMEVF